MRTNRNQARVFERVVSIDAWHSAFDPETSTATIHVDVSFLKARLGEEPESPVRFDVTLRRAEVVFVVPPNEPLRVVQSSVAREKPGAGQAIVSQKTSKSTEGHVDGRVSTDPVSLVSVGGGIRGAVARDTSTTVMIESSAKSIEWAQAKDADGNYKWDVWPGVGSELLGKIWDAVREPLLTVRTNTDSLTLPPVCRVEVRCKKDDILITGLVSKKGILEGSIFENKRAAAEAYIRVALASRDLKVMNFDDPYGDVLIADIFVDEEVR